MKRSPLKRKTRLKRVSKKKQTESRGYFSFKTWLLGVRPYCEMNCCVNRATQLHHIKGRSGSLLMNPIWIRAVCADCHRLIHDNSIWSKENGWIIDPLKHGGQGL